MPLSKIFRVSFLLSAASVFSISPTHGESTWPLETTTPEAADFSAERLDKLHGNLRRVVDDGKYSGYIVLLARDGFIVDWRAHAQMLLNGGELEGVRLLSRKTIELMTQNHLGHLQSPHPFGIPSQGFGLGVRVVTNLGQSTLLGTKGAFGWDGAATTNVQIDPKERTVAILLFQHFPFNEDDILATFTNGYYSSLVD
jgi:CubicO group peptidase (beta-lactamase class C family)